MNLTDDQLRESLHARAERITPPVDVFADVETRARRIRRRRVGASVAGAVAAVVAVAVVVPTLVGSSPHTNRVTVGGPSPSGSVSPSISSTPQTPLVQGDAALDLTSPWSYRGSDKAIAAATLDRFQQDWSAKYPNSGAIEPLWGEIYEPSQQPELVFAAKVGDGARWAIAMPSESGTQFVVDQPLADDTTVLSAIVPGDEVPRLLAVAAPSTTVIRYAPDGVNFTDMTMLEPGVAVKGLEGNQSVDKLQVLGPSGVVVFEGPAPDSAAAPTDQPANVLGWPTRGQTPDGLVSQMSAAYAQSRQTSSSDLTVSEVAGGTDAGGTQYVLAQVWVAGDDSAATVGFLKHADGTTELQLGATLAATAPVAAIDVTDSPVGSHEWIVVVPQPATGQVLYAADGKTYKPVEATPTADGPVVIARDPKAQADRVRLLDGDGKTVFDGAASSLLCGVTSCG